MNLSYLTSKSVPKKICCFCNSAECECSEWPCMMNHICAAIYAPGGGDSLHVPHPRSNVTTRIVSDGGYACTLDRAGHVHLLNFRFRFFFCFFYQGRLRPPVEQVGTPDSLGDSNPGPPSPRGKSQPLSIIFARIGGALEPNDSLKESRDALVTHSSTFPHATRIVFRAFDRSPQRAR
jgi:hypothetical protein